MGVYMEQETVASAYDYRRVHERKIYAAEIVFSHAERLYAGNLKDISLGGAYIETYSANQFTADDKVVVSIPFPSGQHSVKRQGCIKWSDNAGFAVEFV